MRGSMTGRALLLASLLSIGCDSAPMVVPDAGMDAAAQMPDSGPPPPRDGGTDAGLPDGGYPDFTRMPGSLESMRQGCSFTRGAMPWETIGADEGPIGRD